MVQRVKGQTFRFPKQPYNQQNTHLILSKNSLRFSIFHVIMVMLNMTACIWKVCMESFTQLLIKHPVVQITVSVHKNFGYIQVRGKG